MKDMDYSYVYEDNDNKYCYPNTNILKNKLGLIDADILRDAERELSIDTSVCNYDSMTSLIYKCLLEK